MPDNRATNFEEYKQMITESNDNIETKLEVPNLKQCASV